MIHTKSESDVTSLAPSSPSKSPKRVVYYVQSPSRDSHDGDKSSSMHLTPNYNNTPLDSPSHPSFSRHSRDSSASRFSGIFKSSSGRKVSHQKRNEKGWPESNVIMEEGSYDEYGKKAFTRRSKCLIALVTFVVLFTVFCLIIWGVSRPYKAEISVKSLVVHNFFIGEGVDATSVPTKMVTVNATLKMNVYNPASLNGIRVSSTQANLRYSEISVAHGQLKKYYQPRKSHRTVSIDLEGEKIPLYGAGASLAGSSNDGEVPLTLKFEVRSRGDVVGKLVRTKHKKLISCTLVIDTLSTKTVMFKKNECVYE